MASKKDVVAHLGDIRDQIVAVAEAIPDASWDAIVYENGWTERQLLYHIASTSGVASFVLAMSRLPAGAGASGGEPFDNDAFNRDQVAMREGRSLGDALDEVRASIQRSIQDIEAASDDELQAHFTAPWGAEGTVADVIISSLNGHLGTHAVELRTASA